MFAQGNKFQPSQLQTDTLEKLSEGQVFSMTDKNSVYMLAQTFSSKEKYYSAITN